MAKRVADFDQKTIDILARRVGHRCSNPDCRKTTSGPRKHASKTVNIGVGAHICAAEKGGPRFDETMPLALRKSIKNGIWLCQICAKLIDNDVESYPAGRLEEWKKIAEAAALVEVQASPGIVASDVELIRFFATCLDRPAFQDQFHIEGSMEAFDEAMENTIAAINTGTLRDRNGRARARAKGKAYLQRYSWRKDMDSAVDLIHAVRSRFAQAVEAKEITLGAAGPDGRSFYCINNRELAEWMDATRAQIVEIVSGLCNQAGLPGLTFPRHRPGW